MPDVVGVRFKPCGKIYDFEANGIDVNKGDLVVVESELGLNIGSVVVGRRAVEDNDKRAEKNHTQSKRRGLPPEGSE